VSRLSRFALRVVFLLGVVLSPLRAVAATVPVIFAYDAVVPPTATTGHNGNNAARSEAAKTEPRATNDYDGACRVYATPSNPRVAVGVEAAHPYDVHAYDDALNFAAWREVGEGVVCDAAAPTSAAEGAGSAASSVPRIFWTGGDAAKNAAATFAQATGGTTLEMTAAGQGLEAASLPWAEAKPLWQAASGDFAGGASGQVDVFMARAARPDSIWRTIEQPALQANPAVTGVRVHLALIPGE
jgi:hypothetical protein